MNGLPGTPVKSDSDAFRSPRRRGHTVTDWWPNPRRADRRDAVLGPIAWGGRRPAVPLEPHSSQGPSLPASPNDGWRPHLGCLRLQSEIGSSQALNFAMRRIIELERSVIQLAERLRRVWMSTVQRLRDPRGPAFRLVALSAGRSMAAASCVGASRIWLLSRSTASAQVTASRTWLLSRSSASAPVIASRTWLLTDTCSDPLRDKVRDKPCPTQRSHAVGSGARTACLSGIRL